MSASLQAHSREQLIHDLCEAAELEHNLMCTYLYAAFSLKAGVEDGLSSDEAAAVARWRQAIVDVAIDEMGHLTAVWNIASALGAAPPLIASGRSRFIPPEMTLIASLINAALVTSEANVFRILMAGGC